MSAKWRLISSGLSVLTHWGRVTHICVGKLTIIASDNELYEPMMEYCHVGPNEHISVKF